MSAEILSAPKAPRKRKPIPVTTEILAVSQWPHSEEDPFAELPHLNSFVKNLEALFPDDNKFRQGAALAHEFYTRQGQSELARTEITPETITLFKNILKEAEESEDKTGYETEWYVDLRDNNRVFKKLKLEERQRLARNVLEEKLVYESLYEPALSGIFGQFEDPALRAGSALIPTLKELELARQHHEDIYNMDTAIPYALPIELLPNQGHLLKTAV